MLLGGKLVEDCFHLFITGNRSNNQSLEREFELTSLTSWTNKLILDKFIKEPSNRLTVWFLITKSPLIN